MGEFVAAHLFRRIEVRQPFLSVDGTYALELDLVRFMNTACVFERKERRVHPVEFLEKAAVPRCSLSPGIRPCMEQ